MNPRRLALALCAASFLATLSACVDVDASASIGPSGSGRLNLRYAVSRMVAPLGSLEAGRRMIPFPLSRADFEAAIDATDGLALLSYAAEEKADDIAVNAAISFTSPAALASFLDPVGKRAIYSEAGGRRSLRLEIVSGAAGLDPEVARLVETAFAEYGVKLALALPSPVVSAGIGKSSGARAEFSGGVVALIESAQPVIWEIVW